MKYFKLLISVIVFTMCVLSHGEGTEKKAQSKPMRVCSCNIRIAHAKDGENNWSKRRSICLEILRRQNADIYCFQELTMVQRQDIEKYFPGYRLFGALNKPKNGYTADGILYRKSRFQEIGAGAYALSDHPHMIGTHDWGNNSPRLVNYLILQDVNSGKIFRIVNTHLDHKSQLSREKSADLINEESAAYPAELIQILTGDMNSPIDNPAMQKLLKGGWRDTFFEATGIVEPGFTYHAFRGTEFAGRLRKKIDFIFWRGDCKIINAKIVKDKGPSGRYPSDHFFVWTDFVL